MSSTPSSRGSWVVQKLTLFLCSVTTFTVCCLPILISLPLSSSAGLSMQTYAGISGVAGVNQLSFDSSGALFAGVDSAGGPTAAIKIVRIGWGGSPVAGYGANPLDDPDAVVVDRTGVFSGTAGSVLVGGQGSTGISVILPNETITQLISSAGNPEVFALDSNNRLLILQPTGQVQVSTGSTPTSLINLPTTSFGMEVDSADNIYVRSDDGIIRKYSSDGTLLNGSLATGMDTTYSACGLAMDPSGTDLYTISGKDLLKIDPVLGTMDNLGGNFGRSPDLVFGPDNALYVSCATGVLRVTSDLWQTTLSIDLPGLAPGARPLRMVRIPAGSFWMGTTGTSRDGNSGYELPRHQVNIGYDFYMGETEVTQAQWHAIMGSNPASGYGVGNDHPVYYVSWDDCQAFIAALNELGQGTFRLPSEAEWEYACRGSASNPNRYAPFSFGDDLSVTALSSCQFSTLFDQYM